MRVNTYVWNQMVKECTLFDKPIDKLIEYLHVRDYNIINLNISIGLDLYIYFFKCQIWMAIL